jgi:hypothetical protein
MVLPDHFAEADKKPAMVDFSLLIEVKVWICPPALHGYYPSAQLLPANSFSKRHFFPALEFNCFVTHE